MHGNIVHVTLLDGTIYKGKHCIVSTGGMYLDNVLSGIMNPCFSYLVAIKHKTPSKKEGGMPGGENGDSPNYFTFGFSHDWSVSNGYLRISGEDHYSGLKPPKAEERCKKLSDWGFQKYPYLEKNKPIQKRYGMYSETPDHMPLIGSIQDSSKICYLLGCNAWGQASLSCAASLAPALCGFRELTEFEKRVYKLLTIRRFSGKQLSKM